MKDGAPQLVEKMFGVLKIDLKEFLEPKVGQKSTSYLKYRVFPVEVLDYVEFNLPVKLEEQLIRKSFDSLQLGLEEKKEDDKKGGKGQPIAKDVKKEAKKEVKKPTKKGGKEETEKEKKTIPLLELPTQQRQKVYIEKENKFIEPTKCLMAAKIEIM